MKKLVAITSLVALSLNILAGGTAVLANGEIVQSSKTDANISLIAGSSEKEVLPPDTGIDEPKVVIPPVVPEDGSELGPLAITYVPTLNFGNGEISQQDKEFAALAEWHPLADQDGEAPFISFVQVQDARGANNSNGWILNVELSDFVSQESGNILRGAQIHFSGQLDNHGSESSNPSTVLNNFVLNTGATASQNIMVANNGEGAGAYSLVWGDQADLNRQLSLGTEKGELQNNAIKLFVPGSSAKDEAAYEAELTWTLTAGYDNVEGTN